MNRYYDPHLHRHAVKLQPGDYAIVGDTEVLVTVLGSCVAACIRDDRLGIGGMNHFMLPVSRERGGEPNAADPFGNAARYGVHAMELLINGLLKHGSRRCDLAVKVFGGASVLGNHATLDIGQANGDFVRSFLRAEGLPVFAEDLFGELPRKVYFFPDSGEVRVKYLRSLSNNTVVEREREYVSNLSAASKSDVEMFTWPNKFVS